MLENPEFEPEFYNQQIAIMEQRYEKIFKKWKISWNSYYKNVQSKLRGNQYWIWVYLCGFEKFIQEKEYRNNKKRLIYLKQDALERIRRIIGDSLKIEEYIKSL